MLLVLLLAAWLALSFPAACLLGAFLGRRSR